MSYNKAWLQMESLQGWIARQVMRDEVLSYLKSTFRLDWQGIHGLPHWTRVMRNAMEITQREGGDPWVAAWFAVLHDHQRWNEGRDRDHGARAADAIDAIADRGWFANLNASQRDLLAEAIRHHSEGCVHSNASVGACWDADRLDLLRLGIEPSHGLLSTRTAKKLATAYVSEGEFGALRPRLAVVAGGTGE